LEHSSRQYPISGRRKELEKSSLKEPGEMRYVKDQKKGEMMSEVTELRTRGQAKCSIKFPESGVPIYGSGKVERIQNWDKKMAHGG
jgi:hypothetical protein